MQLLLQHKNQQIVQTCSSSQLSVSKGRQRRNFKFLRVFCRFIQRNTSSYTGSPRSYQWLYDIQSSQRSPLNARQNSSTSSFGTIVSFSLHMTRTEICLGSLLKSSKQSSEKRGNFSRYSISFRRKQKIMLTNGWGILVSCLITLLITIYKLRKGLSRTSLLTIFGFFTAKLMAVTAPMLLPHTASLSISKYLQASLRTISASVTSLRPQVRQP